jgi:hypothetical protein
MNYTTIKLPVTTHKLIKDLCILAKLPQQEIIFNSLQDYKKKLFWEQCNSAYSKLDNINDKDDWRIYENTLIDGIEDEY